MDDYTVHSIELPGDVRLQYVEQGGRAGVPVLLLPGFSDSWRSYQPVMPHLPSSARVFAISQRGHGDAGHPAVGYGPHDFAADLAGFLDVLELPAAIIVGHSMSAIIAQRFALDYPARTLGLMLVSWRGYPRPAVAAALAAMEDPIDPTFVREFQAASLARPVPDAFLETMVRESLKVPTRVWRAVATHFTVDRFPAEPAGIVAPTWIVWGDQDASCPRSEQQVLAAAIPGARLVIYPGYGHCLHWEAAARFAADLTAFVQQARAATPADTP